AHGAERAPVRRLEVAEPAFERALDANVRKALIDEVELLDAAGDALDPQKLASGQVTPMFFGSALTNFGLPQFLDAFIEMMPTPAPRDTDKGPIEPTDERFTSFVFKIQANMDRAHRDRMAFVRVCSGRYERGMKIR